MNVEYAKHSKSTLDAEKTESPTGASSDAPPAPQPDPAEKPQP